MLVENIIMDVFLILQFPVKVSAVIIRDHPIGKCDLQILILQFI